MTLNELRRETFQLWDDEISLPHAHSSSSSQSTSSDKAKGRQHLLIHPNCLGPLLPLSFSLQSPSFGVPLSSSGLSFRLPNLEREYFLATSILPVGHTETVLCRCPVQVLAGDEAPGWEEVVRETRRHGGSSDGTTEGREAGGEKLPNYA